jgi:hypothetical protein
MVTASPPARGSRWPWLVAAAAAVVVFTIVAVLVLRAPADATYDDAVQARFMDACTAEGGEPVRDTCACLYGELERTVPFARFEAVDEQLAAQLQAATPGQSLALPDDVRPLLDQCVASAG